MKKIDLKYLIVIVLLFFAISGKTQDMLSINLETVLEMGGANNLTIEEYRLKQELAVASYTQAKEWWLPQAYAGIQIHQLWGASMNADGRFFLDVNRNSLWNGIGINAQWNFAEGIYKKKAAELQIKSIEYLSVAEKNKTLLEMISVFYNLLTAQVKYEAYQQLVWQSDTLIQQIEIQVNAQLLYQSDLLLAKANYNHLKLELLNAKTEFNAKSTQLAGLLNLDLKTKLICADSLLVPVELNTDYLVFNDTIYKNRPEILSVDYSILALQKERQVLTTGLFIPTLSLGTYGSFFGDLNEPVSPMFPNLYPTTQQLYPTGALNISLNWNIPLGQLIYGGEMDSYNTQIKLQELKSEQLTIQINEEIITAQDRILIGKEKIILSKEALELSFEALYQSIERQKLGTSKPYEVFQAQQFYLQARLDYILTIGEYNKYQYALKVALGESL